MDRPAGSLRARWFFVPCTLCQVCQASCFRDLPRARALMYLVVFRSRKRADHDAVAYARDAQHMVELAGAQPGCPRRAAVSMCRFSACEVPQLNPHLTAHKCL